MVLHLDKNTSLAHLIIDGQKVVELSSDDEVTVTRDKMDHYMIRRPHHNFFELLKEKLKFGDRYVAGA